MTNFVFNPEAHIFVEQFHVSTYTTALRIVDTPSAYQAEFGDGFIVDKETRKILFFLSGKWNEKHRWEAVIRPLDPSYKFHDGGITWVDDYGFNQCEPFVFENVPANAETWKGRGYTGGHVSQSHWIPTRKTEKYTALYRKGTE